jgi:anaerobic magnesium-protoporphyrin IX monomethyl ester cyclase
MKKVLFADSADPLSEFQTRYFPMWPCYLATYAGKRLGGELIEFRFAKRSFETELADFAPDMLAIGSVTQNWSRAIRYAKLGHEMGIPVIVGGSHISLLPQSLSKDMTAGVIGEGEQTFYELMQLFLRTGKLEARHLLDIRGLVLRDQSKLVRTSVRPPIKSLNDIPHPDRSLIGYNDFSYIVSSRGCPFKCAFCASSKFWDTYRVSSAEYVVDEIEELNRHGCTLIRINDDLFTIDKSRLRRIASSSKKEI